MTLSYQQGHLIEALLTLARSERGVDRWEPLNLAELAHTIVQDRRQEAERQGVRVQVTLAPAPATGDRSLMGSLVTNLVDNALRHNVAGGRVEISTTNTAGRVTIVHAIAVAHHATLTARPRPDGGLHITVAFPPPGRATG